MQALWNTPGGGLAVLGLAAFVFSCLVLGLAYLIKTRPIQAHPGLAAGLTKLDVLLAKAADATYARLWAEGVPISGMDGLEKLRGAVLATAKQEAPELLGATRGTMLFSLDSAVGSILKADPNVSIGPVVAAATSVPGGAVAASTNGAAATAEAIATLATQGGAAPRPTLQVRVPQVRQ